MFSLSVKQRTDKNFRRTDISELERRSRKMNRRFDFFFRRFMKFFHRFIDDETPKEFRLRNRGDFRFAGTVAGKEVLTCGIRDLQNCGRGRGVAVLRSHGKLRRNEKTRGECSRFHSVYPPLEPTTNNQILMISFRISSLYVYHVPEEYSQSLFGCTVVECLYSFFEYGCDVVVHYAEGCHVFCRPCMGTEVRFAVLATSSLYVLPTGEATDGQLVQYVFHFFDVGLVICYECCFHFDYAFMVLVFNLNAWFFL